MALFDSGTPLANVALSDTFNTWRVRTNQINTQAAGLASNNTFTGTNNIFNGTLQATTANFTTLQADAIDFDGDLTVDLIAANTINAVAANFTTLQADAITFDGDLTVDTVTANTLVGTVNVGTVTGTLAETNGGTGHTTYTTGDVLYSDGSNSLAKLAVGSAGQLLTVNSGGTNVEWANAPAGGVTSVDVSGGSTGLTTSGGAITGSGTITIAGQLTVASGGTGASSASAARTALGIGSIGELSSINNSHWGGTVLQLSNGGTASSSAAGAASNLGLGTNDGVQFGSLGIGTTASGTTGEIRATNNVTAYYSDERLKTKLGAIEDALGKVNSLSGFYYEANQVAQDLGYDVKREVGVSAQEVQAVLPEIVVAAPISDEYLTVHYDKLVPLLIEAIKELTAKVEILEAR